MDTTRSIEPYRPKLPERLALEHRMALAKQRLRDDLARAQRFVRAATTEVRSRVMGVGLRVALALGAFAVLGLASFVARARRPRRLVITWR